MIGIARKLRAEGLSAAAARAKERLFARCADAIDPGCLAPGRSRAAGAGARNGSVFFVPGRIELLGKHTDYAGGRSLLCAVDRGFVTLVRPRSDSVVRIIDAARDESRELLLDPRLEVARADWATYAGAAVRRVARNFPGARRGADIAFASDLPQASGMSSSSALTTTVFLALGAVNRLSEHPTYRASLSSREALAAYLGTVENGRSFGPLAGDLGVGTFGGSEDHTAIICCRSGFVSRYSFAPIRAEGDIAFPADYTLVVAHSGVPAEKGARAQALYNRLALAVERIVELWNAATCRADHSLAHAVESGPDAPDRIRALLRESPAGEFTPQVLLDRFEQFLMESYEIVPQAAEALARVDVEMLGALVDRSQEGAERWLRNQIPETITLARLARREGADAASAFGAGFGGSVWALVRASESDGFVERWRAGYRHAFPDASAGAEFIVTRPGPGAVALEARE